MQTLVDLAHAIDSAADAGDEELLRRLGEECESQLETADDEDRVFLYYYQANTHSAIIASQHRDPVRTWSWEQADGVQDILLLRRAISEPTFATIEPIVACQIRTNLANRLSSLGRPVAANEQWLKVSDIEPRFAKALANRAIAVTSYAGALYDEGHRILLLAAALSLFDTALHRDAIWESGDRALIAPELIQKRDQTITYLTDVNHNENLDLHQWSLGATDEERSYRHWCLRERLFLNPLNDVYTESVAATDVLHLPNHIYKIGEPARFPTYYNVLKQEYVSARYRLYRATHEDEPGFLMRDVLILDGDVEQVLGHYTEELRSAFRSAYAIFDKIGLFMNDYLQIGFKPRQVTFRGVWYNRRGSKTFTGHRNWLLRGLYFLSKDLFDPAFEEVSEPDAGRLARMRQQVEHRFLGLQHVAHGESTETRWLITVDEFRHKTLRLLRMAREALIYLSLAMHREEELRTDEPVA